MAGVNPRKSRAVDPELRFPRYFTEIADPDACWEWQGARRVRGYGKFSTWGRRSVVASRYAWERAFGPIPPGLQVCHRCDNPPCVRPSHLFVGTQLDNVRDQAAKGRWISASALKTHCKRGHPLDGPDVWRGGNLRKCRACARIRYQDHADRPRLARLARERRAEKRKAQIEARP